MRNASFSRIVRDFVESQELSAPLESGSDQQLLPGAWLRRALSLRLVCVGLGYRDGYWGKRFLERVDTRTVEEMRGWDDRTIGGWVQRNATLIPRPFSRDVATALERGGGKSAVGLWHAVLDSLSPDVFGFWGPGDPGSPTRLVRLQGMFLVSYAVASELDRSATFSFMTGRNRELGGMSPTIFISRFGEHRYELVLSAFAEYMGGYEWQR
jgi:hypothetical protein